MTSSIFEAIGHHGLFQHMLGHAIKKMDQKVDYLESLTSYGLCICDISKTFKIKNLGDNMSYKEALQDTVIYLYMKENPFIKPVKLQVGEQIEYFIPALHVFEEWKRSGLGIKEFLTQHDDFITEIAGHVDDVKYKDILIDSFMDETNTNALIRLKALSHPFDNLLQDLYEKGPELDYYSYDVAEDIYLITEDKTDDLVAIKNYIDEIFMMNKIFNLKAYTEVLIYGKIRELLKDVKPNDRIVTSSLAINYELETLKIFTIELCMVIDGELTIQYITGLL